MTRLQYLESLDSVRLTRLHEVTGAPPPDEQLVRLTHLQVFLEVLVALALGRTSWSPSRTRSTR